MIIHTSNMNGSSQKVEIINNEESVYVKKDLLLGKIRILYRNTKDSDLKLIVNNKIDIKIIKLKGGAIYFYKNRENHSKDISEIIINDNKRFYDLLKDMKYLD